MTDHGEDGCFEVFAGIALIAAFAIVGFGWPVSGYVLGLAATSGVLKIVAAAMQPENREATRRERVVIGALKSGGDTALWLAVGCGLVLVLQLGLALFPGVPDATAMADAELYFADALACLRERLSVWTFLALFAVALALAMAVGALWPINLVAQSRRWIGKGISVLGAVSAFSFVGANDLGARYEASAASLRAQLAEDLTAVVEARRDGAAYHWLGEALKLEGEDRIFGADGLTDYIVEPVRRCARDQATFLEGARRVPATTYLPVYCDERALRRALTDSLLAEAGRYAEAPNTLAWLPDFAGQVSDPAVEEAIDERREVWPNAEIVRLSGLRGIYDRARQSLRDANAARDGLRGVAVAAVSKAFSPLLPDEIEAIVDAWTGELKTELAKKASAEIAARLRRTRLARNGAVAMLIEPKGAEALLRPPPEFIALGATAAGERVYSSLLAASGRKAGQWSAQIALLGAAAGRSGHERDELDRQQREAMYQWDRELQRRREAARSQEARRFERINETGRRGARRGR